MVRVSVLEPTYYRRQLSERQKVAYRQITGALLAQEREIRLSPGLPGDELSSVVQAVHLDHPELFYVNFWSYQARMSPQTGCYETVCFNHLLDGVSLVEAFSNRIEWACKGLCPYDADEAPADEKYSVIARNIARTVHYKRGNNENAFLYHTVAGAALYNESVCEGISKLFLLACHIHKLPCIVISGRLSGRGHSWNMVETDAGLRHLDVTSMLGHEEVRFLTDAQLRSKGYTWGGIPPTE